MEINRVGKFEVRNIVNSVDRALIDLYGTNMTDARITRFEVLGVYEKTGCPVKAAEHFALEKGLSRLLNSAA
jgi:hypothetical protein